MDCDECVQPEIVDQYIVSAVLVDEDLAQVMTTKVILVTSDEDRASKHDVSSYKKSDWMVLLEHVKVSQTGLVVDRVNVRVLHPSGASDGHTRYDA
jgi:hypothetical protein